MNIHDYLLDKDEYVPNPTRKISIFLHHTAGGGRADWTISTWNKDARGRIATAFVVSGKQIKNGQTTDDSHDGHIYRAFPEECWAYHLGEGLTEASRHSIGIEICNYGYLYKGKDGRFYNFVNSPIPDDQVVELSAPFRGHLYWHRYTDAQIESTRQLLQYLGSKFNIDLKQGLHSLIPKSPFGAFEYNLNSKTEAGIWTHTNIRRDKTDCSPQPHLLNMIMSL